MCFEGDTNAACLGLLVPRLDAPHSSSRCHRDPNQVYLGSSKDPVISGYIIKAIGANIRLVG